MDKDNLKLWHDVSKTDPAYTRHVQQRGGYTAISPQYQALKATEQFGSYGKGWGLAQSEFDFGHLDSTGMVLHRAVFFYTLNDERIEFVIHNAIQPVITYSNGNKQIDEDWAKKVETNTISKALSKLGFSADVFMGMFDDNAYVQYVGGEFAIEKADNADEERERQRAELQEWYHKNESAMKRAASMSELEGLYKSMIRKLSHRQRNDLIHSATKVKDQMKEKIESKKK